jgi:putative sigma-54 modulation protein
VGALEAAHTESEPHCGGRTEHDDPSSMLALAGGLIARLGKGSSDEFDDHLEVTPALREYVLTKLDRVTRHFDQVVDITVLLSIEKLREKERRQKAEVTLHVKGRDIFVEQSHEDLYAAIDQLMDKLDRQVCRHKDRVQDHHHPAPKRIAA